MFLLSYDYLPRLNRHRDHSADVICQHGSKQIYLKSRLTISFKRHARVTKSSLFQFSMLHNTHTRNLEIIVLGRKIHVTIVSIPPHTSHKGQPLDKTFMEPLKTYYSEYVSQVLRLNDL